jgi:hypothetical protein
MHATERRGRCVEVTTAETAAASNWSRPAATTAGASSYSAVAAVIIATLRLPNQSRARKKRGPIEFSFHDFDFVCLFVWLFLKFIISLA